MLWETKAHPRGTYIGMVRHNIDTIVNALVGETTTGSTLEN